MGAAAGSAAPECRMVLPDPAAPWSPHLPNGPQVGLSVQLPAPNPNETAVMMCALSGGVCLSATAECDILILI